MTRATLSLPLVSVTVASNAPRTGQLRMVADDAHTTRSTGRQEDSTIHVREVTGVEIACPPQTAHKRTRGKLPSRQIL